jgi:glycerol-3-phosphate acyltransferase PlsX
LPLEIVPADDFITMEDKNPAASCRRRQGASIVVAMRQVAEGHADAVVSAGATGASSAAALFQLKRLPGIERPAIAARMPTSQGEMLLLDAGANVDSTPFQVAQHALMGSVFASQVMGFPQPRVGLLNIGEEPGKGSQSYRAAFDILDTLDGINFVGNVEGRTLAEQDCEVLVADGFVGNIFLKAVEGSVKMSFQMLHQEITRNFDTKMGALMCKPAFMRVRHERLNYAHYGGAVLLGVGGAVVIAHGISNDLAIKNAIKLAADTAKAQTLKHIQDSLAEDRMHGKNEG